MEKRDICRQISYSEDEWETVCRLSAEAGKRTGTFIREKAVNGKILLYKEWLYDTDVHDNLNYTGSLMNEIARTVNSEKSVTAKDMSDIKWIIDKLEETVYFGLKPFKVEEM